MTLVDAGPLVALIDVADLHHERCANDLSHKDAIRCLELMQKYQDMPMDFADASLVAIAERNKSLRKVFTIDRQFHAIRLADGQFLEIVP